MRVSRSGPPTGRGCALERNVRRSGREPEVDGVGSQPPNNRRVLPARSTSVSSMLSPPNTIAKISAITLRPAFAAPGRLRRNPTSRPANRSIPSRVASVATNITPGSDTARSSSNRPTDHPV